MLKISDITIRYDGATAVNAVSLDVSAGEIVTIVGPNGSGKSSLLKAMCGLVRPTAGTVEFEGFDITGLPAEQIAARGISLVPDTKELFLRMTCRDNLRCGLFMDWSASFEQRAQPVFDLFPRLRERMGQSAGTLSGGEQQMLAIGRALMQRPRLLCLDEPSLGLSPALTGELFRAIAHIRAQGCTVLLVEQKGRLALGLSDRAYMMSVGVVTHSGLAGELLADSEVLSRYFGI